MMVEQERPGAEEQERGKIPVIEPETVEAASFAETTFTADGSQLSSPQVVEEAAALSKPPESLWMRLRKLLNPALDVETYQQRLRELDRAVEAAPDVAGNYILRGELLLQAGEYEQAQVDFQCGLEQAQAQFEASDWGVMAQALRDRALYGLEAVRRKSIARGHKDTGL